MNTGPSPLATAACWAFVPISCFSAPAFELAATGVPKVRVFAGLEGRRGFAGRRRPTGWGEAWGRKDSDGSLWACGRRGRGTLSPRGLQPAGWPRAAPHAQGPSASLSSRSRWRPALEAAVLPAGSPRVAWGCCSPRSRACSRITSPPHCSWHVPVLPRCLHAPSGPRRGGLLHPAPGRTTVAPGTEGAGDRTHPGSGAGRACPGGLFTLRTSDATRLLRAKQKGL